MADTETLGYYWCLRHQPYLQQKDALTLRPAETA